MARMSKLLDIAKLEVDSCSVATRSRARRRPRPHRGASHLYVAYHRRNGPSPVAPYYLPTCSPCRGVLLVFALRNMRQNGVSDTLKGSAVLQSSLQGEIIILGARILLTC